MGAEPAVFLRGRMNPPPLKCTCVLQRPLYSYGWSSYPPAGSPGGGDSTGFHPSKPSAKLNVAPTACKYNLSASGKASLRLDTVLSTPQISPWTDSGTATIEPISRPGCASG